MSKILVINDSADVQIRIASFFKVAGEGEIKIIQAFNPAEARKKLEENPDVKVIMMDFDFGLGWQNGAELTRNIIENGFTGEIIAMSSSKDSRMKIVKAGAKWERPSGTAHRLALSLATHQKN